MAPGGVRAAIRVPRPARSPPDPAGREALRPRDAEDEDHEGRGEGRRPARRLRGRRPGGVRHDPGLGGAHAERQADRH
mgnify:CR=1 FL=1